MSVTHCFITANDDNREGQFIQKAQGSGIAGPSIIEALDARRPTVGHVPF